MEDRILLRRQHFQTKSMEDVYKDLCNKEITIIDDDPVITRLLNHFLNHHQINNKIIVPDDSLIKQLDNHNSNLIITDLYMGDYSGFDVIKYIRKDLQQDLPIIVSTGSDSTDKITELLKNGATDYFTKGQDQITDLVRILDFWINFNIHEK